MEEKLIEKFFKKFKTITKKNLTRKERRYYCASLEAILQHIKSEVHNDLLLREILSVPITDWYNFFHKINILDRNYRQKFEGVYSCYQFFKSGEKITEKQKTEIYKPISSKKFIKSLIKLINSGNDDILVDKIIGTDFSIKQLFKLYHLLNIYLGDNDYRRDILLNTTYNKITSLIDKYAKQKVIKKSNYVDNIYPIDKYKDRIRYLYLKHKPLEKISTEDKEIRFDVDNGFIENSEFYLSNKYYPVICSPFNCTIPIFTTDGYVKLTIKNVKETFISGSFFIGYITVKSVSEKCTISLKIREKSLLSIPMNICKIRTKPIHVNKSSTWILIYKPTDGILLFGENFSSKITSKLSTKNCDRLIQKLQNSKLSIEEIFSRDSLSGNLEHLKEIMNKNK